MKSEKENHLIQEQVQKLNISELKKQTKEGNQTS